MAYGKFAYFYDDLNQAADYDGLYQQLLAALQAEQIYDGIIADLGCGTGEMTLRLADAGYDMIAVDASEDMLAVFREKARQKRFDDILFLQQPLDKLDLYGTIRAAVATFDTLNHLPKQALADAIQKVALFLETGGVFMFDINTPYKHREILANNTFVIETDDGLCCQWKNRYQAEIPATCIALIVTCKGETFCKETFMEYSYTPEHFRELLTKNGFIIKSMMDGEGFDGIKPTSQRILITAVKAGGEQE